VIRLLSVVAVLAGALVFAPASMAAAITITVNDPGDAGDPTPLDPVCDSGAGPTTCTLRAAIQTANANSGNDTINFSGAGQAPQVLTKLPDITDGVTVDGGAPGATITFDAAATGPLLSASAPSVTLRRLVLAGGATGPVISSSGAAARLDRVRVHDTPGVAILLSGSAPQLTSVTVQKPAGAGISISGPDAALTSPAVSGSGGWAIWASGPRAVVSAPDVDTAKGNGIMLGGDGSRVDGGSVHNGAADGIAVAGQGVTVSRVAIWGNAGKPIALAPGANGGILPPQDLRIGPRQADGSLPFTGSTSGGAVELWSGNPFGPLAPIFFDAFNADPGAFSYRFQTEPPAGSTFGLILTAPPGTSEVATVNVPQDIVSPDIVRARGMSPTEVRVQASKPLDPATIDPKRFTLSMAGRDRAITSATLGPDGTYITLISSGWKPGEAGYVQLTGAGVIKDPAGNNNLAATRLRVAAAPGKFTAPIAGELRVSPRSICMTRGRNCRSPGMTIKFVSSDAGKATIVVQRVDKKVGKRVYPGISPGVNTLRFDGILSGRKLRSGRYRLLLYVEDEVGNVTDQPPIVLFDVRRVTR
jgi:CSLREA domain-containing protein